MSSLRNEQCSLPSPAQSIERYEVRRSEAFKRIRNRERSIKEAFARGRTRQGYTAGHSGGLTRGLDISYKYATQTCKGVRIPLLLKRSR